MRARSAPDGGTWKQASRKSAVAAVRFAKLDEPVRQLPNLKGALVLKTSSSNRAHRVTAQLMLVLRGPCAASSKAFSQDIQTNWDAQGGLRQ